MYINSKKYPCGCSDQDIVVFKSLYKIMWWQNNIYVHHDQNLDRIMSDTSCVT